MDEEYEYIEDCVKANEELLNLIWLEENSMLSIDWIIIFSLSPYKGVRKYLEKTKEWKKYKDKKMNRI